ncbi:MAG: CocE/NonD family hydrolase, partial [Terriglobales bacterium]
MIRCRIALATLCLVLVSPALAFPLNAAQAATQNPAIRAVLPLKALTGEFTNSDDPDTPLSFYPQDGKLVVESSRLFPTTLNAVSATEFEDPDSKATYSFTINASGQASAVAVSDLPGDIYQRTGDPVHHVFHDYQRSEAMIPMRDGVKLHAVILKPADITPQLPFLMQRTPYGCDDTTRASFFASRPQLARDGYIYVCEDIRGRFKSVG